MNIMADTPGTKSLLTSSQSFFGASSMCSQVDQANNLAKQLKQPGGPEDTAKSLAAMDCALDDMGPAGPQL